MRVNCESSQLKKRENEGEKRNKHETFIDFLCYGIGACE